ncbi:MAG: ATP-binding protein [Bdellovibrionales bacterium]
MPIKTWLSNLAKVAGKIENPAHAASVGEALESMNEELNSLRKMVDNFARFGKLSEPEIQKTDLRELLSRFMQENLARPGVTLSENFEAGEFPCLCDASIFKQTLSGLVDNAAEANPGTQVEIKFSLRKLDGFLELEVFNSGREIYAMDSAKIFEPYFSTKMRQGNMGLGLAIAKMNILKQNGDILHVPVKGGVLFKITLPALGKRDL